MPKKPRPAGDQTTSAPATLRECLAPLAAAAIQTSVLAYSWGIANRQLMRAGGVMALCDEVVKEANRLIAHEVSAETVTRDVARQMAATSEGGT